jgi:hypothetical protein
MAIGKEYGIRLMAKSRNFDLGSLERMLGDYPSHGFVIDGREDRTLFLNVRDCKSEEPVLLLALGDIVEGPEDARSDVSGDQNWVSTNA